MLKHTATRSRRESGMAVIVTAISLLFLIPLVGLAIDGGVMFVVRARLGAALDSAALAAGRGLTSGTTQAAAETAGTTSATDFLLANFPNGYLNTSYSGNSSNNYGVTSSFSPNSIGTLGITITATINSPTYFMRWLGVNSIPVSATGSATRPNLVIVLVLDKSSSMGSRPSAEVGTMPTSVNYSTASSCEAMVYNANAFTQNFSPFDTVAEISFDATVSVDYAPSTNFKASGASGVSSAIANIQCGSNTNTTGALAQAAAVINAANQPAALNHIVLFTDGVANGVNAAFPVRTAASLGGAYDYRMSPGLPITGAGSSVANNTACGDTSGQSLCNMTTCATGGTTITGVITQVSGFSVTGGNMNMYPAFSQAYPYTSISASGDPALAVPAGCTSGSYSNFNNQGAVQMNLAYIPATDRFGNSTSSPWGDSTWDGVLEQVNSEHRSVRYADYSRQQRYQEPHRSVVGLPHHRRQHQDRRSRAGQQIPVRPVQRILPSRSAQYDRYHQHEHGGE